MAKRLMDYGFHAPTVSFPVAGTLMVEPTESETQGGAGPLLRRDDRHPEEIREVEDGRRRGRATCSSTRRTPPRWSPRTSGIARTRRELAAFPSAFVRASKFWPAVGRLNNVLGDRKLICSCPPIEDYA